MSETTTEVTPAPMRLMPDEMFDNLAEDAVSRNLELLRRLAGGGDARSEGSPPVGGTIGLLEPLGGSGMSTKRRLLSASEIQAWRAEIERLHAIPPRQRRMTGGRQWVDTPTWERIVASLEALMAARGAPPDEGDMARKTITLEREIRVCDGCGSEKTHGHCRRCGKDFCARCREQQAVCYSSVTYASLQDVLYCRECDAALAREGTDPVHQACRELAALMAEWQAFEAAWRPKADALVDRIAREDAPEEGAWRE